MAIFLCPRPSELKSLVIPPCLEQFGQIVRLIVQRRYDDAGNKIEIDIAANDPKALATWTALNTAADSTKVIFSPEIGASSITPGEPRNVGGGNATPGGETITLGSNPSAFVGNLLQAKQSTIETLKSYCGEDLQVFFINEDGQIAGEIDDHAVKTKLSGFHIRRTWFIMDKKTGDRENLDYNGLRFEMQANWSDKFYIFNPDFPARTLANA